MIRHKPSLPNIKIFTDKVKNLAFFTFLFGFFAPFIFPEYYKQLVLFQFLALTPVVLLVFFKINFLYLSCIAFLYYCALIYFLSNSSGSIFGYASVVILGIIFGDFVVQLKERKNLINLFYLLNIIGIFMLIFLAFHLVPNDFGNYFGVASINYVSLSISSFSLVFVAILILADFDIYGRFEGFFKKNRLTLGCLLLQNLFSILVFETRTVFFVLLSLLIVCCLGVRKSFIKIFVFASFFAIIVSVPELYLGPGRDFLSDVFFEELWIGSERFNAIASVLNCVGSNLSLLPACKSFSYSSLFNFVAYLFPFSIFYVCFLLGAILIGFLQVCVNSSCRAYYVCLLTLLLSFLLQSIFHPDFYSLLGLFFVCWIIVFGLSKRKLGRAPQNMEKS